MSFKANDKNTTIKKTKYLKGKVAQVIPELGIVSITCVPKIIFYTCLFNA